MYATSFLLMLMSSISYSGVVGEPQNWHNYDYVAHGLGAYGTHLVSNSADAMLFNYYNGQKVFEVDLIYTSDDVLIANHDWRIGPMKYQRFVENNDKDDALSMISFAELVDYMVMYPDMYIVTDTKYIDQATYAKQFADINRILEEKGVDKNRVIPQVYTIEMYNYLANKYDFGEYIWTLYQVYYTDTEVVNLVKNTKISTITMGEPRVNQPFINKLKNMGLYTYVHTINDQDVANRYLQMGLDGVYTDKLY